jgi:hypothetical protein
MLGNDSTRTHVAGFLATILSKTGAPVGKGLSKMAETAMPQSDSPSSGLGRHSSKLSPKSWMFKLLDTMALLGGARYRWQELPGVMKEYRETMQAWKQALREEAQGEAAQQKDVSHKG